MKYVTILNDQKFEIEITTDGKVIVNGNERNVDFLSLADNLYSIIMNDESYEIVVDEVDGEHQVLMRGQLYNGRVLDERALLMASRSGGLDDGSGEVSIKAPMPGLIVAVPVEEGQEVTKGSTVVILESMKMQNELKAPRDGVIQRISVEEGQSVEQKKVLVTLI